MDPGQSGAGARRVLRTHYIDPHRMPERSMTPIPAPGAAHGAHSAPNREVTALRTRFTFFGRMKLRGE